MNIGLVSSIGNPASRAVVPLALGSVIRPPPNLLGMCAAVDEKAAALLSARDQAMLAATATLQVFLVAECVLATVLCFWACHDCLSLLNFALFKPRFVV